MLIPRQLIDKSEGFITSMTRRKVSKVKKRKNHLMLIQRMDGAGGGQGEMPGLPLQLHQ